VIRLLQGPGITAIGCEMEQGAIQVGLLVLRPGYQFPAHPTLTNRDDPTEKIVIFLPPSLTTGVHYAQHLDLCPF